MSSSPSRATLPPAAGRLAGSEAPEVSPFPYSDVAAWPGQQNFLLTERQLPEKKTSEPAASAALELQREAQLRELGRQQGALECRTKFEEQLAAERTVLARALADFARERATYYQKLEEAAVRLALSIARKVLYREAQVDPLLLMGIVRVALERIEGATGVALLVHPQQAPEWRRYLAAHLEAGDLPEIVEDPALELQQCILRTSMGTADLGLEPQLKEIEQGLMDLLAARPQEKP
jgi:flagellar biosynthesis/type III secretory pathway protein FliH